MSLNTQSPAFDRAPEGGYFTALSVLRWAGVLTWEQRWPGWVQAVALQTLPGVWPGRPWHERKKSATAAEIHADLFCGVTGSWIGSATVLNLSHSEENEHIQTCQRDCCCNVVYDPRWVTEIMFSFSASPTFLSGVSKHLIIKTLAWPKAYIYHRHLYKSSLWQRSSGQWLKITLL